MTVTASAIDVHLAYLADAPTMAAIHAACFARSWNAGAMAQFLVAPGCFSLLASTAWPQSVQGFVIVRSVGDEAELFTLAVHPDHRRIGLARALLGATITNLRAAGPKHLFIEMADGNAPARGLYQSLGAVVVGRRKGYYEYGADADIFSLAL